MSLMIEPECAGRRIGYARVSTKDQRLRMQRDALKAAGCDLIFEDHGVSGAKDSRPGLDRMLEALRPGDMVIVYKLDRLGRSVLHLSDLLVRFLAEGVHFCSLSQGINTAISGGKLTYYLFSAVAECQRDMIVENTIEGLAAARRRGKRLGRPPALSDEQIAEAHRHHCRFGTPIPELADRLGVSRMTLTRGFARLSL